MAAPNMINVVSMTGRTKVVNLSTTNNTEILANPGSSNAVYKVNFIRATNVDGVSAADITLDFDDNGTVGYLASTISVPADSTLSIIGKDNQFYLEEGDSVSAQSSSADDISILIAYEIITDTP